MLHFLLVTQTSGGWCSKISDAWPPTEYFYKLWCNKASSHHHMFENCRCCFSTEKKSQRRLCQQMGVLQEDKFR